MQYVYFSILEFESRLYDMYDMQPVKSSLQTKFRHTMELLGDKLYLPRALSWGSQWYHQIMNPSRINPLGRPEPSGSGHFPKDHQGQPSHYCMNISVGWMWLVSHLDARDSATQKWSLALPRGHGDGQGHSSLTNTWACTVGKAIQRLLLKRFNVILSSCPLFSRLFTFLLLISSVWENDPIGVRHTAQREPGFLPQRSMNITAAPPPTQ